MSDTYGVDSITSLGFIEGAKKRPSTFLENIGTLGILKLIYYVHNIFTQK